MTQLILLCPYLLLLAVCIFSLRKKIRRDSLHEDGNVAGSQRGLTIVLCISHESPEELEQCLAALAQALASSDCEADEAVLVLDGASAAAEERAQAFRSSATRPTAVIAHKERKGKKAAQREAVAMAHNADIVAIDADCTVAPLFLSALRQDLHKGQHMLLLPVAMRGAETALGRMTEMEFTCLQVVTAGTALAGFPTMANGAGMAFSKQLYAEHDSHPEYASGDDMFLLQHAMRTGATVAFSTAPATLVETAAPATVSAYVRQRARWLSKSGGYGGLGAVHAVALATLLANMAWPAATLLAALGISTWSAAAATFLVKLAADTLCYAAGKRLWRNDVSPLWALPLEALYPLMIAVVGFKALLKPKGSW